MRWGEFQSVIQLATALNLAYYAVPSLWYTYQNRMKDELSKLGDSFRSVFQYMKENYKNKHGDNPPGNWDNDFLDAMNHIVHEKYYEYVKDEQRIGIELNTASFSLIFLLISLAGIITIVVSSIYYSSLIPLAVVIAVICLGFGPIVGITLFNVGSGWFLRARLLQIKAARHYIEHRQTPDPTSKVWSLNTNKNPMDAGVS
jgi:hypothetical protein